MRSLARLVVLAPLALGPSFAFAAEGDAPPPRPAAGQPAQGAPRVVVPTFTVHTTDDATKRLGAVAQQGIVSELSSSGTVQATAGKDEVTDVAGAANAARSAGARYAVFGTVQSANGQVRITGQVYDAQTGRTVAPLKATGSASNFFAVQDDVVRQAQAALGVPASPAGPAAGSAPTSTAGTAAVDPGSHWAGYEAFSDPARSAPAMAYPPPQMAPPPLYGLNPLTAGVGYGYGFGGGFFDGFGYGGVGGPFAGGVLPGQLGTARIERFGQLGVSNAPPPPTAFNDVRSRGAGSFLPTPVAPTQIPAYARPVQDYRSPNTRFPSPVGQPQRAAPPNLRPGGPQG